jgi:glycosyltransferase involved in cell wall biosynthesis
MRLLFITSEFPNPYEPTKAVFNQCLVGALAREHHVQVVSPISWVDECRARWRGAERLGSPRQRIVDGVEVHYPRYLYTPGLLRNHYGLFFWHSARSAIQRALKSRQPDLVIGYWAHPDGDAALGAARLAGVPAVVMVGGSDVLVLGQQAGRGRRIRDVLHAADAVIATSHDLKAKVVALGLRPRKVHVVHRGVDTDRFSPGDRSEARRRLNLPVPPPIFLWAGRMVPVKGLDVLLQACGRLHAQAIRFHVCLVGDGPLRPSLERHIKEMGMSESFTLVGAIPHDQLPDWYRAANVTVLPSRSEGVPNVLRESLACGTPFVASRVGGIPEIAREGLSLLVPPEDSAALATALMTMLAAPAPAVGTRQNGWTQSAQALIEAVRPLVAPLQGTSH